MLRIRAVQNDFFFMAGRLLEALRGLETVFPLADFQFVQGEFIIFGYQFRLFQRDFQAVGAGSIGGGGDKYAGCAIGEFQICRHIILHLDIVPFSVMAEGAYPGGHSADPLQQIQIVRALIQKNAAAFSVPGGSPAAGVVVSLAAVPVRNQPAHALHFAVFPALDNLVHFSVNAVGALVEHHAEDKP